MVHPHQKSGNPYGRSKSNAASSLQDRLHTLLLNLTSTSKILQKWPDSQGDNASIHFDTTTKLIHSLQRIIHSVKSIEDKSLTRLANDDKGDIDLKKRLREYQVPLDLLDLMDYGHAENDSNHLFGLNPDCFFRGLLREALRQLAELKRRKVAMEMLGKAIEKGIREREIKAANAAAAIMDDGTATGKKKGTKRARNEIDEKNGGNKNQKIDIETLEKPPSKRRPKTE